MFSIWKLQQQPYNKEVSDWFHFSIFLIVVSGVQQSSSKYIVVCASFPTLVVPLPLLSPHWCAWVSSLYLSLFLFCYIHSFYFSDSIYKWWHTGDIQVVVFVFLCPIYFTKHSISFHHVCVCAWITSSSFSHLLMDTCCCCCCCC